jgi:hypothetical protein
MLFKMIALLALATTSLARAHPKRRDHFAYSLKQSISSFA